MAGNDVPRAAPGWVQPPVPDACMAHGPGLLGSRPGTTRGYASGAWLVLLGLCAQHDETTAKGELAARKVAMPHAAR